MLQRYWVAGLAAALLTSGGIVAKEVQPAAYQLNIGAQPMDDALNEFARQSGLQVILQTAEVKGIKAPKVEGTFTVQDALGRLLENSGLEFEYLNERTVAVRPKAAVQGKAAASEIYGEERTVRVAQVDLPASQAGPNDAVLEEIVVTAQKRVERLQDVPVPVTSIGADSLVSSNQLRLQDYYTRIPGLSLTPSSRGGPMLAIRGVTTGNATGPTVGIVVDDLPYGPSTGIGGGEQAPDIDPGDLARVEVLRGPQGTLYGASNIGGLIKYVTADPSTDGVDGRVQGGLSSVYNGDEVGYNLRGSINVPLGDAWAVRASGFTRREPGYIDNIETGQNGVNRSDADGGRLSMLWRPSEDFSLRLSALRQNLSSDGSSNVVPPAGLGDLQQSFLRGTGGYTKKFEVYSTNLSASLGRLDLIAVSGYSINTWSSSSDYTASNGQAAETTFGVSGASLAEDNETSKFTQEVRLSAPIGQRLEWLLGAFYTNEDTSFEQRILAVDPATGASAGEGVFVTFPTTFEELALFTDLTWKLTDRFDVQVGGRRSQDKQTYMLSGAFPFFNLPDPFVLQPKLHSKENAFTYLLTPRFKVSSDLMVYARLASGYRAGGPNTIPAPGVPTEYDPDKTQNYEIGLKGDFLDHALSFDASLYYVDWKDIQLNLLSQGGIGYYANAGGAKSQGVELSVQSRPLTGLTVAAWVAWNDASLTDAFPPSSSASARPGDQLPFSSHFSGSLSLDTEFPLIGDTQGFAGGSVSYVDAREGAFTSALQPRQTFPSYTKLDLRAGLKRDTWTVNLFVNNVADKRGTLGSNPDPALVGAVAYIQPRTVGLSLMKDF
jgi:outer membrane receptor protein involved in Fe transport